MKPKIYKEKFVSKYVDSKSAMLHDFVQKSDNRLRKMRAGSNLVGVINHTSPNIDPLSSSETYGMHINGNLFGEETLQDFFQSHEAHNSLRRLQNNGRKRKLPVSEFMESYLSTKEFDEKLQLEKEKKLELYFKEKLNLMSRYLGEGVLKEFLERPNQEKAGTKKPRDQVPQEEDDFSPNQRFNTQDGASAENSANPYAKIHKINREIISQLMREEHEQHLENLRHLQIQQDMQAFNDLKEHPDRKKVQISEASPQTSIRPTAMKTSFMRNSLPINEENSREQEFRQTSYKAPPTASQLKGRPGTSGSQVLLQNAPIGSEQAIPNLEKIIKKIEAVKVLDGIPESKPKRHEQEEQQSIQAMKDINISRESPQVRQNLFASQHRQLSREARPVTQHSEKVLVDAETDKVLEALEKYNENLKFLEIQKEIEKSPHVRPKTQENLKQFANTQRAQTSRAGSQLAPKFEEETTRNNRKKNTADLSQGSLGEEQIKEGSSPFEAKTAYYFMKPIKELSPKPLPKHLRNESTKSQESKTSFPFDGVESTRQIKIKKNPMNYYQRYALGKIPAESRTPKDHLSRTGDLRPIRVPTRLHANNSSAVLRPKKVESVVVRQKPKATVTEMINLKPAVLNLQLDPKKNEYTGYATSGSRKNIIMQQKKPNNSTWKQPLF